MKLVLGEREERSLRATLSQWSGYVSSALLGVEAVRACGRHRGGYARDAREWLHDVALLPLTDRLLDDASRLRPAGLRSLDCLHLATALSVREEIGAFACYDERLGEAAAEAGLPVVRP